VDEKYEVVLPTGEFGSTQPGAPNLPGAARTVVLPTGEFDFMQRANARREPASEDIALASSPIP
jgi:hypothetical protein